MSFLVSSYCAIMPQLPGHTKHVVRSYNIDWKIQDASTSTVS